MRNPIQVLVIPYRKKQNKYEFAIFLREDMNIWQGIAGGVEDDEKIIDAAKREAYEEAGLDYNCKIIKLDSYINMPVISVAGKFKWGKKIFLIKEYAFGIDANDKNIILSFEHKEYRWLEYNQAINLLKFDSNKNALWELNERLKREK